MNWQSGRNLFLALTLVFALPAAALQAGDPTVIFKLAKDRVLFAQVTKPADASKPTFVMLPGVNRGLLASETEMQSLVKRGFGVVSFNFSAQPLSVAELDQGVVPYFHSHDMTLKDLADETDQVVAAVKRQYGLTNLIPVSLSYSGAISPFMQGYPLIIETVPMTSAAAENPQLEVYRQSLKAAELWNPIFGPSITRASLDASYRTVWVPQVQGIAKQFNLPADRSEEMVEGYTALSRAVEGFSWDELDLSKNTRRVFVLAAGDGAELLRHQIQTFLEIAGTRTDAVLYLVMKTGHIIPSEQPEVYADILDQVSSNKIGVSSGVVVVDPMTKESKRLTGAQATAFLKSFIN